MMQRTPPGPPDKSDGYTVARQFLTELFTQLEDNIAPEDNEYNLILSIAAIIEKIPGDPMPVHPAPLTGPAAQFWTQALSKASGTGSHKIIAHLRHLEPFVSWIKVPHYREHHLLDTVKQCYTCFEIMGTHGFFRHQRVTIGVLLMGPEFYYPSHAHPDAECIIAFSGRGTWHLDNGPIISIPAGARVFIPQETAHTFWSMEDPFAAIYLCLKDLEKNG